VGKVSCRAQYYCFRMVQEDNMLAFKPSIIAATAVLLALRAGKPCIDTWVRQECVPCMCGLPD